MIKILERGELPHLRVYKTQCSNCKTRFEFTRGDASVSRDPRDGDLLVVKCPLPGCAKECYAGT